MGVMEQGHLSCFSALRVHASWQLRVEWTWTWTEQETEAEEAGVGGLFRTSTSSDDTGGEERVGGWTRGRLLALIQSFSCLSIHYSGRGTGRGKYSDPTACHAHVLLACLACNATKIFFLRPRKIIPFFPLLFSALSAEAQLHK